MASTVHTQLGIYLDNNATTRPHPKVIRAMQRVLKEQWANPSSLHAMGREARQVVEEARARVAALLGALPAEILFTSGGTEANSLAILGLASVALARESGAQVVTSPLEHPSVLAAINSLASYGFPVRRLRVDRKGRIDLEQLGRFLSSERTMLVSLALVNHEIGNIYPIADIAALCHSHGALLHCDAVQAAGRLPVQVSELGVDLLTFSAHKIHGPKGAAALYVRGLDPAKLESSPIGPILGGGKQEGGLRAGTENVPAIAGFGVACDLAARGLAARAARVAALRDRLEAGLRLIPDVQVNGDSPFARAPGTLNVSFAGVGGEVLMSDLDASGIAVSTGAACRSGSIDPSPVLLAMGLREADIMSSVRFSLCGDNHAAEVDHVINVVTELVARRRRRPL